MDEKAIRKAGYKKGVEEGKADEKLEIARKMKEKGLEVEQIKEITGLNQEEIDKL